MPRTSLVAPGEGSVLVGEKGPGRRPNDYILSDRLEYPLDYCGFSNIFDNKLCVVRVPM